MNKNNNYLVGIAAKQYKQFKEVLENEKRGYASYSPQALKEAHHMVDTIESAVLYLTDVEYLIVCSEVLEGKTGRWYASYISDATYFRRKKKAYERLVKCLSK